MVVGNNRNNGDERLSKQTTARIIFHCGACGTRFRMDAANLDRYADAAYLNFLDGTPLPAYPCHHCNADVFATPEND